MKILVTGGSGFVGRNIAEQLGQKHEILAPTHFDAAIYTVLSDRITAGKKARSIFRNTVTARDGMAIDV